MLNTERAAIHISLLLPWLRVCAWTYSGTARSVFECATKWLLLQDTVTINHISWIVNERANYMNASDEPQHNYQSKGILLSAVAPPTPNAGQISQLPNWESCIFIDKSDFLYWQNICWKSPIINRTLHERKNTHSVSSACFKKKMKLEILICIKAEKLQ